MNDIVSIGMRSLLAVMTASILASGLANADALPPLACTFPSGVSSSYTEGVYKTEPSQPLNFDIESIDLDALTARLSIEGKPVGNPLRVVRALNANHFLEAAQEGFLNVTTIYDLDKVMGARPAIHSRHLGLLGEPIFSQYAGFCRERSR